MLLAPALLTPRSTRSPPTEGGGARRAARDLLPLAPTPRGHPHWAMESTSLEIRTGRGSMPAYSAVPTTPPPWPGVVVIHDFTGMSQDLRGHTDWLAREGFLTIAPDLYYWGSRLRCLRRILRDLGARRGRSFDDVEAARQWLRDHDGCTGVVGVVGFCMGGGYAIALAEGPGFDASAVSYGGCPSDARDWLARACSVVGSFGGADRPPWALGPVSGWTGCSPSSRCPTIRSCSCASSPASPAPGTTRQPPWMPGSASSPSSTRTCAHHRRRRDRAHRSRRWGGAAILES